MWLGTPVDGVTQPTLNRNLFRCLALSFTPDAAPETHALASAMYEASRACVMASERREQPTYAVIAALLSQTVWLKVVGCPSFGFTYYAQAIRFAQSMGLHREPAVGVCH